MDFAGGMGGGHAGKAHPSCNFTINIYIQVIYLQHLAGTVHACEVATKFLPWITDVLLLLIVTSA
jgi:hypothetical protein